MIILFKENLNKIQATGSGPKKWYLQMPSDTATSWYSIYIYNIYGIIPKKQKTILWDKAAGL
jgi:hypothetical protein